MIVKLFMDRTGNKMGIPNQLEIERLKYTISRFDHYYDSVNSKNSVILAVNVIIGGSTIELIKCLELSSIITLLGLLSLILGTISIVWSLISTIPYTKSSNSESLYYFGSINEMSFKCFAGNSESRSEPDDLSDLRNQVHSLAKGLNKKFKNQAIAIKLAIAQTIILILTIILNIIL